MEWARHEARMGEIRNVCKLLMGKSERKRPLGRLGKRWEVNIKTDLNEIWWKSIAQNRGLWRAFVNTVMSRGNRHNKQVIY
jgi:hypothetical protein